MSRVKTFANSGTLLPDDLNKIEDDYENTFSSYKETGLSGCFSMVGSTLPGTYCLFQGFPSNSGSTGTAISSGVAQQPIFYFNSNNFSSSRINKIRIKSFVFMNAFTLFDPTTTITTGLYPVSSVAGSSGNSTASFGPVVSGTTSIFTGINPGIKYLSVTSDITSPSSGYYLLGYNLSKTVPVNTAIGINSRIQIREI